MEQKLTQLQAKLESDKSLGENLFSLKEPVDVQNLLKEQGLEFSLEELGALKDAIIIAVQKKQKGELTDEDLESVAGGAFNPLFIFGPAGPVMLANIKRGRW